MSQAGDINTSVSMVTNDDPVAVPNSLEKGFAVVAENPNTGIGLTAQAFSRAESSQVTSFPKLSEVKVIGRSGVIVDVGTNRQLTEAEKRLDELQNAIDGFKQPANEVPAQQQVIAVETSPTLSVSQQLAKTELRPEAEIRYELAQYQIRQVEKTTQAATAPQPVEELTQIIDSGIVNRIVSFVEKIIPAAAPSAKETSLEFTLVEVRKAKKKAQQKAA